MLAGKEYIKKLPQGMMLTAYCKDLPEYNSLYQTAWTARSELGLDKTGMRISRKPAEMKIEIERYRDESE